LADVGIAGIEIVQVVQTPTADVHLVAGKSTVVRVLVRLVGPGATPVEGVSGTLEATAETRGPLEPAERIANDEAWAMPAPDRADATNTLDFKVPRTWTAAGRLQLKVTIAPPAGFEDPDNTNNVKEGYSVLFEERNALKVGYLVMCVGDPQNPSAERSCPQDTDLGRRNVEYVYPVADGSVEFVRLPGETTWKIDLTTEDGWHTAVRDLGVNWALSTWSSAHPENLPQALIAFVKRPAGMRLAGLANGRSFDFPVALVDEGEWTLAHELGHILGLQHTAGSADPRCDLPQDAATTDWNRGGDDSTGEIGWDMRGNSVVPARAKDLMSYCAAGLWIGPFHYAQLFDGNLRPRSQPGARRLPPGALARRGSVGELGAVTVAQATREVLVVRGVVERNGSGGSLEPSYRLPATDGRQPALLSGGPNCIRLLGDSGLLAEQCFGLDERGSAVPTASEPFVQVVPFAAGTKSISLAINGVEVASMSRSAAAPQISLTTTQDPTTHKHTLSWTTSDADDGTVVVAGLYSTDGETWQPLAIGDGTQVRVDSGSLLADQIWFRLLASDGLNTTQADSGPLLIRPAAVGPLGAGLSNEQLLVVGVVVAGVLLAVGATLVLRQRNLRVAAPAYAAPAYPPPASFGPTHVVPMTGLPAFTQPDASSTQSGTVGPGTPLVVAEWTPTGWARVVAANGWSGWVDGRLLAVLGQPPPPTGPVGRS
jgi:hypothetical protein